MTVQRAQLTKAELFLGHLWPNRPRNQMLELSQAGSVALSARICLQRPAPHSNAQPGTETQTMSHKIPGIIALLLTLAIGSSCASSQENNDSAVTERQDEPGSSTGFPAVGAQERSVPGAARGLVEPEIEHLLQPFEMFAPNAKETPRPDAMPQLPRGTTACSRNAAGAKIRQQPLLYGPEHEHQQVLNEFFEGVGGRGLTPSCFNYGESKEHGFTYAYHSQLTERSSDSVITWNYLPEVVEFEAEARHEPDHLRMEVRTKPIATTGETYWLDHCVGQGAMIFNEHSRYYYFNPEPVEIDFEGEQLAHARRGKDAHNPLSPESPVQMDSVLNPHVESWWTDLAVQGKPEPYLLMHQPDENVNLLLYWQQGAILKVYWKHCIHVNPAFIGNGTPQTLVGELYLYRAELGAALAFARARVSRDDEALGGQSQRLSK